MYDTLIIAIPNAYGYVMRVEPDLDWLSIVNIVNSIAPPGFWCNFEVR